MNSSIKLSGKSPKDLIQIKYERQAIRKKSPSFQACGYVRQVAFTFLDVFTSLSLKRPATHYYWMDRRPEKISALTGDRTTALQGSVDWQSNIYRLSFQGLYLNNSCFKSCFSTFLMWYSVANLKMCPNFNICFLLSLIIYSRVSQRGLYRPPGGRSVVQGGILLISCIWGALKGYRGRWKKCIQMIDCYS